MGKATLLAAALLLGAFLCPPAGARNRTTRPEAKRTQAAKQPSRRAKRIDVAKIDLLKVDGAMAMRIDLKMRDRTLPAAWVVLGFLEGRGGNLAGAKASLEYAMALGERRPDKAAVATAAIVLGKVHSVGFGFLRADAKGAAMIGGSRPSDDTANDLRRRFESVKALYEKAIALYEALGRKDGTAAGYAQLGELYMTTADHEGAKAAIGKALALNKALRAKKQMAANYRALADAHRYDLDHAASLLKQAIALHEELGLKEELATDYEKLGAISRSRGQPYEAIRQYRQVLTLAPERNQAMVFKALEHLYRDLNDPGRAVEMKEKVRNAHREHGGILIFDPDLGMWVSGFAAKMQVESLEKVVAMERALGNRLGRATSYALLGMHYANRAENDKGNRAELLARAETMFKNALALNKRLRREKAIASAYRQLALLHNKRGNPDQVQAALKDALPLHKKLGDERSMAQLYFSLGYERRKQGDTAQACAYWRKGAAEYPNEKTLLGLLTNSMNLYCTSTQ